jgi:iron complex outermembrane receptor protein
MGQYAGENFRVVGGFRQENTDWDASSRLNGQEDAEIIARSGKYDDLLPSIVYSYDFSDRLKLRLAYGKTLGRPDAGDLAASETLPEDDGNGNFRRSNPNLKPRRSNNIDAALEYYFDDGGSIIAFGVFTKDIKDEIFVLRDTYTYTYLDPANDIEDGVADGVYNEAVITQPMNAGTAGVDGFELSIVKSSFDFLPGVWSNLGAQFSWTHTDGSLEIVDADGVVIRDVDSMAFQPENVLNAALFFEGERLSARVAYLHSDKYYNSFDNSAATLPNGDSYYEDDRWDSFDKIDLHFAYDINENFRAFFDVSNLTSEARVRRYGEDRLRESVDNGRSLWLGVSYSMN